MLRVLFFLILVFALAMGFFLAGRTAGRTDHGLRRLPVSGIAAGGGDPGGGDGGGGDDHLVGDQGHLEQAPMRWRAISAPDGATGGYQALSTGMIAAGAGDFPNLPRRKKKDALKLLSSDQEPLILLLEARRPRYWKATYEAARSKFEAMLKDPELKLLGLRGLYLEAPPAGRKTKPRAHYAAQAAHAGAAAVLGPPMRRSSR